MKLWKLLAGSIMLALMVGCAMPMPKPSGDPGNPLKRIAVLPLVNDTNDVDAPEMVRERLVSALERRMYNVQPLAETNQILVDQLGITMGGQLEMAESKLLAEKLGVEGLFFGELMDFSETTTGVYNSRNVRGRFRLVNALDDSVFWHNGIGVKSQDTHGGTAGDVAVLAAGISDKDEEVPWVIIDRNSDNESILTGMALGLGTKLISKATGTHLRRETDEMIRLVFETLPVGPGDTLVAAAPAGGAVQMPEVPMPAVPVFGYVDFGDRDFSAILVSTTVDKQNNRQINFEMPVAKAGSKFRTEIDYASMTQGESMPPAFSKMISIHYGGEKKAYMLFPKVKKYMVDPDAERAYESKPDVSRTEVAREVVDGHPTIKYQVRVIFEGEASPQEGFVWRATDLGDMIIKSEMENETVKFSTLLKNIVLKTPDPSLFEVPADYVESKNFMEIVTQQQ
ncbi:MAG: DUF799 family lipoprotein [Deltaproteobacteria bacterium]|nr:DUF799 family lipoprotein [Deltaproteobacteria bacterium]